jgi:hypothetical protein
MNRDKILSKIAHECDGLVYISETDAPIRAFLSEETTTETHEKVLSHLVDKHDEPVEELSFDLFFERLTAEKDWYGEKEKIRARKFQALKQMLEDNLSELRVIKIGRVRKEIFIVGLDKDRRLVGAKTEAVET